MIPKTLSIYSFSVLSFILAICILIIAFSCQEKEESFTNLPPGVAIYNFKDTGTSDTLHNPLDTVLATAGKSIRLQGSAGASAGLRQLHITLGKPSAPLMVDTTIARNFYRADFHAFSIPLTVPVTTPEGVYTLTVQASDQAGQESAPVVIRVLVIPPGCGPIALCRQDEKVTLVVETPGNTPGDAVLHVVGDLNGWSDAGAASLAFTKNPTVTNCYCLAVDLKDGQYFKITRGTWDSQERKLKPGSTTEYEEINWARVYKSAQDGTILRIKIDGWTDR